MCLSVIIWHAPLKFQQNVGVYAVDVLLYYQNNVLLYAKTQCLIEQCGSQLAFYFFTLMYVGVPDHIQSVVAVEQTQCW